MNSAIISLGALGLTFGLILAIASYIFKIKVDERVERINAILPGANCGGCGYPGCNGYAEAIVKNECSITLCAPGGNETIEKIAEIMGISATKLEPKVAIVKCLGNNSVAIKKADYKGANDCIAANLVNGGDKGCEFGCLGYGSCVKVCRFDAIFINSEGIAEVIPEKCTACGTCIEICPRNIIELVPASKKVHVLCKSIEKGGLVKKVCEVGCIGCKQCERICPTNAITVNNNLATIDYSKCIECTLCVSKCPVKIISGEPKKEKAKIGNDCIGCGICKKVCPVNAISGELKQKHIVDPEKCVGCGICVEKCPKKVIELI